MKNFSNLDSLRKNIFDQFQKEDYHIHIRRLNAARHKLMPNKSIPKIIESSVPDTKEYYSLKPVKGSIIMFMAKKGNSILNKLERAYDTGDLKTLQKLSTIVDKEVASRKVITVEKAVDQLIESPAIYDLNYGEKALAANVALINGLDYGSMAFAWNGGELDEKAFNIVELTQPHSSGDVEFLLVKTKPVLSKIEIETLKAVPKTQLGINIGTAAASPAACLVLVAIIVLVTNAGQCGNFHDALSKVSLPASTLERLGKTTSAAELLSLRREVFESYGM